MVQNSNKIIKQYYFETDRQILVLREKTWEFQRTIKSLFMSRVDKYGPFFYTRILRIEMKSFTLNFVTSYFINVIFKDINKRGKNVILEIKYNPKKDKSFPIDDVIKTFNQQREKYLEL